MPSQRYHHGDLRSALLREATALIRDAGVESLSLRALAGRVGVTQTALYHHFRDKNDLLCALAERGFEELDERLSAVMGDGAGAPLERRLADFVRAYVGYTDEQPERYDLMFSRAIWRSGTPTASLRRVAHACFRKFSEQFEALVTTAGLPAGTPALRAGQVTWAMLHGLCRQRIDGIYADPRNQDALADEVVRFLLARLAVRADPLAGAPRRRRARSTH